MSKLILSREEFEKAVQISWGRYQDLTYGSELQWMWEEYRDRAYQDGPSGFYNMYYKMSICETADAVADHFANLI